VADRLADRLLVDVSTGGQVTITKQIAGNLPDAPVGPPVPLASPLDADALDDIRWYLEDYLVVPYGVYEDRGERVADQLEGWGTALFASIFGQGPARDAYKELRGRSKPVELIIRSSSPATLGLPWELMQDPERPTALALDLAGMSRSLPGAGLPTPFEASGEQLRVLMVIARPGGTEDIGYQMVARPLLERLDAVRGQVDLSVLRPPTFDALQAELRTATEQGRPYQIVHFDGHGVHTGRRAGAGAGGPYMYGQTAGEGFLQFEASTNATDDKGLVSAAQFALALKRASVPLVVLNACQSAAMGDQVEAAVATRLLQEGIGAVVAMGYSVYAVAAAEFMAAFYETLFAGGTVTAAVAAGRQRLFQRPLRPSPKGRLPLSDWMVPVHYLRSEVHFPHLVREAARPGQLSLDAQLDRFQNGTGEGGDAALAPSGEFVGRDAELYELERQARERRVVVVHGPGGSGKTELAKAFGRWWRDTGGVDNPDWIVWHSFEPGIATFGLDGALSTIGLQLFGPDFARLDPADRRAAVVRALREHRLLIVWDNFESAHTMPDPTGATPALTEPELDDLRTFLAKVGAAGGKSAVLVTSRTPERWLDDVGRLRVNGLAAADRAEYADLLVGSDPAARARRDDRAFGELLEWLAGHPLSMRLVLPHLATTDAATLLAGLQGTEPLPVTTDRDESRTTSLAASITYSFDHLTDRERTLLTAVSLFHGVADADVLGAFSEFDDVPERFKGVDNVGWKAVLDRATDLGLLAAIGTGTYQIHPALPAFLASLWQPDGGEAYARDLARSTDAFLNAYARLSTWLHEQIKAGDAGLAFSIIAVHHRALCHALNYALSSNKWGEAQALIQPLERYLHSRGLHAEADSWDDRVRTAVETPDGLAPALHTPPGELWVFAASLQINRLVQNGDLGRAKQSIERVLEPLSSQPPSDAQQRQIAVFTNLLGTVVQRSGDLDEADRWFHQALAVNKALDNRPGQANSYHALGVVALRRREVDEADRWHRMALEIYEDLGDRPAQATTYHQLGRVAELRGDLDDAERQYLQAITIKTKVGDRLNLTTTYNQLGIIAHLRGRFDDAEQWYHRALVINEELNNRPGLADIYHQLGIVAQARGNGSDAERWCHKSLAIEESLGRRPGMALSYLQLGILAEERGELREALNWNVRCVALFEEFPHPLTESGPNRLVEQTKQMGMGVLEEVWLDVTGVGLPEHVRAVVEQVLRE
jgi:tetratricopeptide (TPR) repeat protein